MFIDNLKMACVAKGTSPTAILKELGMSTSSVTAWKNGVTPSLSTIYKVATHLNVDPAVLLKGCQPEDGISKKEKLTQEGELDTSEEMLILNRAAKNMTSEQKKKLLDMARLMFMEEFDCYDDKT